jgi:6-phosphogluconolactonase (cycloisomerase 2 family)
MMKTIHVCACVFFTAITGVAAKPARAQTQTPERVYATTSAVTDATGTGPSIINGFTASSGTLTTTSGTPYSERIGEGTALAADSLGRFLFVANFTNNSISMFQIDSSTGALTEVQASPFASGPASSGLPIPTGPLSLAVEPTGQYLYVGYSTGAAAGESAVITYVIDATHLALVPMPQFEVDQPQQSNLSMLVDAHGRNLYVADNMAAQVSIYQINAANGSLTLGETLSGTRFARSLAMDPQTRFLFYGSGQNIGSIEVAPLSPIDSLPTTGLGNPLSIGVGDYPGVMSADSTGTFLYAAAAGNIFAFAINQTTGSLTAVQGLPQQLSGISAVVADPRGPYLYASSGTLVRAFQINTQTGALTEVAGSPFGTAGGVARGLTLAAPSQTQGISGPIPVFDSTQVGFGAVVINTTISTMIDRMGNNGSQALLLAPPNAVTISGINAGDFHQSNTCPVSLASNAFCSISVTFTPTAIGLRQATLSIADNASGSPQIVSLSGTGSNGTVSIALSAGTLTFSTILAGTASAVQNLMVMNAGTGTATLSVSSVALSGANFADFSFSNGCTAPIAPGASCPIGVTFTPMAAGLRTAQLTISNSVASPQSVSLSGTASPFAVTTSSTTSTVKAGVTAQYALTLTPGAGFSGSVALSCAGAPQAATCVVPAAVQVNSGSPAGFTVMVTTTAGSNAAPFARAPRTNIQVHVFSGAIFAATAVAATNVKKFAPIDHLMAGLVILAGVLALFAFVTRQSASNGVTTLVNTGSTASIPALPAWQRLAVMCVLLAAVAAAGCGAGPGTSSNGTSGSSGGSNPSITGTPSGTYTLTVTATSGQVAQQFPLTLTVQ